MVDQYPTGGGCFFVVMSYLSDEKKFEILDALERSLCKSCKRHGSILSVTKKEMKTIKRKWSAQ